MIRTWLARRRYARMTDAEFAAEGDRLRIALVISEAECVAARADCPYDPWQLRFWRHP